MLIIHAAAADWVLPDNSDPHQILAAAKADTAARRFEDALAKHEWFYDHVLEVDESFYGVRLSFALADWHVLAQHYPPAQQALHARREAAEQKVLQGEQVRRSFHDLFAINRELNDDQLTVAVFMQLDHNNRGCARGVQHRAAGFRAS